MTDAFNPSKIPDQPQTLVTGSSSILGYSYDSTNMTLDVFYKGKSNSIYRYFYVYPNVVSQIFDLPQSVGKAAQQGLKGLQHQRLK